MANATEVQQIPLYHKIFEEQKPFGYNIFGGPNWCHRGGANVKKIKHNASHLLFQSAAAELKILPHGSATKNDLNFFVEYKVVQSWADHGGTEGRIWLPPETLASAFGLADFSYGNGSKWLLERYGASCAGQGMFIRWKQYLNIPGPGTGHDGDSNISIELYPETIEAVRDLLNKHGYRFESFAPSLGNIRF